MALINCSECNAQISDKAVACIKCGAPIAQPNQPAPTTPAPAVVVTTQQTSKKFKFGQVIGALLIFLGVVSCADGHTDEATMPLLIVGVVVYLVSIIAAWWNHG